MQMNLSIRPHRLGRAATAVFSASLVLAGVLQTPAGAVVGPPYNTSTTIHHSVANPVTGQSETFTAVVKALHLGAPVPTGQVQFTITGLDFSTVPCDGPNPATLVAGVATCTVSAGLLHDPAVAPYTVSASYTGAPGADLASTATPLTQAVLVGLTNTAVTSSVNPTVSGQQVSFTASVAPSGAASGAFNGVVTFSSNVTCIGGNAMPFTGAPVQCMTAGLNASGANVGSTHYVVATYSNDPNFSGSNGKVNQVVNLDATTVALTPNPNVCTGDVCTAPQGTPITFTAAVTANAPGSGTPTGKIQFSIVPVGSTKSLICDGGNIVALDLTGQASCTFSSGVPAIVYYIVKATLIVDPNFLPSSATLYENSALLATNTSVLPDKGVSAGMSFNVTATVTMVGTSSFSPTGQVDISVCGPNSPGPNGCQGGAAAVQPDGTATLTVGGGEFPGTYYAYATYLGDLNFQGSTAKPHLLLVGQSPTTIAIFSSENPSITGDPVTLTATVVGSNGSSGSTLVGPPSGVLTFTITGPSGPITTCNAVGGVGGNNVVPLNNGPADEGVAQCFLEAGTLTDPAAPLLTAYTVTVSYASDGNYRASTKTVTQTVVPPAL